MKIAYFDCFSGISGDMILGALLNAGLRLEDLRQQLAKLSLAGWKIEARPAERGGISATQVEITVTGQQQERRLPEVLEILSQSQLNEGIVERARAVFSRLAEVEAKVHGIRPSEVHFHEVGATDAMVDVVGSLVGLELLDVQKVYSSPLRLGRGFVQCQHGRLPVPAPATVELLRDVPLEMTDVQAELVTPTGAALITALASAFGASPPMRVEQIGYGAGRRDLKVMPNLLRVFVGRSGADLQQDQVVILETNVDDMSPELSGPLVEILMAQGALDAFLIPVVMKKGRPAVVLKALVPEEKVSAISEAIFRHTTTLGIRIQRAHRTTLPRQIQKVKTRWGSVAVKVALFDGVERISPEFEECLRVSKEHGLPLWEVYQEVREAWKKQDAGGRTQEAGEDEER